MAQRQKEQTNKFLEITDPKKAVGLWSYRLVRETAMTPVGNTAQALGRFLNGDIVRWEHRARMAEVLVDKGVGLKGGMSPARAIGECLAEADADKNRLSVPEWREKYAWLLAWSRYACRLVAPNVIAAEKDVQMFFGLASAGVSCHEGTLHGGRVFFLRKKVPGAVVPGAVVRDGEPSTKHQAQSTNYRYFVAVVLKPGGTKWWAELERVNVTWTANTYDRLIIDPRGKLEWSPMAAEVLTEKVVEKDVCLFQLEADELFSAITDNELNPNEKYAHLCYAFDFFCRQGEKSKSEVEVEQRNCSSVSGGLRTARPTTGICDAENAPSTKHQAPSTTFYLRWSAFFNPRKSKFDATSRQAPRLIEEVIAKPRR